MSEEAKESYQRINSLLKEIMKGGVEWNTDLIFGMTSYCLC
jgi:hypothetical protein